MGKVYCNVVFTAILEDHHQESVMISQLLFDETAEILEEKDGFYRIASDDDETEGWIDHKNVIKISGAESLENIKEKFRNRHPRNVNKVYFSILDNKEIKNFEPNKDDWDIQFTRYNHVYFDMNPVQSYIVNGVLLNPNKVQGFINTTMKYEDIKLIDTMSGKFLSKQDVIGFDWKYYNIDKALYSITPKNVYIIRSVKGLYYKLRFIDFYDENKQKGNPTFQYELLK